MNATTIDAQSSGARFPALALPIRQSPALRPANPGERR
jgi:hypothetical protein